MTSTTSSTSASTGGGSSDGADSGIGGVSSVSGSSSVGSNASGGNGSNSDVSANASATGGNDGNNSGGSMNNIEAEYNKIPNRDGWNVAYQEIRERSEMEAHEKNYRTRESEKSHNRCLNRYRDVNPYDHSRIVLHRGSVDYINANLVKLERAERKYILTQGPLSDTVGHFWLMVWEQNTKAVLMLNKLMEKKQVKCHMYWPEKRGPENALKLEEVKLSVEFLRREEYKNYCRRWFKLTDLESNQSREIMQFHYTTWPDFGIPSSPVAFLQFLKQARDSGALDPDVGPAVVHCSAGIGRSGTFCLVDCCLVLIEKEGENKVSVKDVLYEMRRYRMGLIQTADQLYFSYQAIIEGIKLLKDPKFLEYNETPIIRNDDQQQFSMDETPPPLPPRTHSLLPLAGNSSEAGLTLTLNLRGSQTKPLPKLPASESFNDDMCKDALNNFIKDEMNADSSMMMMNRPLPPVPPHLQAEIMNDSDSDMNELFEDDTTSSDEDNDSDDDNEKNGNGSGDNIQGHNAASPAAGEVHDMKKLIDNESNSKNNMSPDNELKRRKRVERQANIEHKVNEIKRKQREVEEGKQTAKKRRSLVTYIAAGVIVGVICVYAYSKLS